MMITAHWSASPLVLAGCAAVAAVHLAGFLRSRASGGPGQPRLRAGHAREALIFYAGLVTVLAALVTPLGYWSVRYVWVRAIQDLLLATVAPPLIVLGAPWLDLRQGLAVFAPPGSAVRRVLDAAVRAGRAVVPRGRPGLPWWLTGPALAAAGFNLAWLAWHLPAAYDLALSSRAGYAAEVACYLGLGIAFWLALIGSAPMSPRLSPLRRVALVVATVTVDTVLGMALVFGSSLLYPSYRGGWHHVLSVVADQQVAGAVLWMGMLPTFVIVTVALLLRWLNDEESEDLATGLERLLGPRGYTWPSTRGLK